MKIYRFVPNARDFPSIIRSAACRWWPEGIDLGPAMVELYPKTYGDYPWPYEGNRYEQSELETGLPDFPAFALNLPIVTERGATSLVAMGLNNLLVPITVSSERFFAVQPTLTEVDPNLPQAFVPNASRGLKMPGGEIFFYYARTFDPAKIPGEFFTIPEFEPFSDLYVTERIVDAVRKEGLTGLEYLELVYDDGPIVPRYPHVSRAAIPRFTLRRDLETELVTGRCSLMSYPESDIEDAIEAAVSAGYMTLEFSRPESGL